MKKYSMNIISTMLASLFMCLSTMQAQQLYVSTNSKYSSVNPGIRNDKRFVVKAGKYEKIYTTKNCFIAVNTNGTIDLLDRNSAKKIGKQQYRFESGFAWNIKQTIGREFSKEYDHRFYILCNEESQYKKYALYDLDMNPVTDFIYDGMYCDRFHSSKKIKLERLIIKKGDLYGIMLENGKILVEPQYQALAKSVSGSDEIFDVFEVRNPGNTKELLYHIHPDGKIAYGANALKFFQVPGKGFDLPAAKDYLLSNLDSLRAEDKSVLGYINISPAHTKKPDNDEGFEWLLKAYREKATYYTALQLAYFLDREPRYNSYLEQTGFYVDLLTYLSDFKNIYAYKLGEAYAYGKGAERNIDKAIEYFRKTTNTSENVLYDGVVTSAYGELAKLYNEKGDNRKRDDALTWYMRGGRKDNPLTGKAFASMLRTGQVVNYQGKAAAVASVGLDGVTLSDGRKIPLTATNYTSLNTSNESFLVKCIYCYGRGKITRTYKNVKTYSPTYTRTEYIEGTSISGAQIKTTTYGGTTTQDIHVEGQCYRCNGTGKIIPATEIEKK